MRSGFIKKPFNLKPVFKRSAGSKPKFKSLFKLFGILAFFGGALYVFLISNIFKVESIFIEGGAQSDAEEISAAVKTLFSRNLISGHIVFINKKEVASNLVEKFPVLTSAEIKKKFPNKLIIKLAERQSSFVLSTQNQLFLVGNDGQIITEIEEEPKDFRKLVDLANAPVKPGRKQFSQEFLIFFARIDEGLKAIGLKEISYEIPQTTFELRAKPKNSYAVYFDTTVSADDQLEKYKLIVSYFKRKKIKPSAYVNLTVKDRVYYR